MVDDSSTIALNRLAINAALNCEWEKALIHNKQLLKVEPDNVACLNRLAKAYSELGKYSLARKTYHQVLSLDPYNAIAQKNLKKISAFKKNVEMTNGASNNNYKASAILPSFFLEEPGITRVVNLTKVAEPKKILMLSSGQLVNLVEKNRGISVTDHNNQYLGALPDDTAHHLRRLIQGGNKYQALVKSVKSNGIALLIREMHRSKKFKNQASFLGESKILSYSSDHLALLTDDSEDDPDQANTSDELGYNQPD